MKTTLLASLAAFSAAWSLVPSAAAQNKDTVVPERQPAQPQPELPGETADTPALPDRGDKSGRESDPRPGTETAPANETEFVTKAAKCGMGEVKVAELAVKKAHDPKVKEFAEMLVKDHTAANQELKTVAAGLNIRVSDHTDTKADQKYKDLNEKTGKEFDTAFMGEMAMCHEKGIAFFEAGKKVAKSEQVTAFIDKALPVLKGHAEKLERMGFGGHGKDRPDSGTRPGPATDPAPDSKPDTDRR